MGFICDAETIHGPTCRVETSVDARAALIDAERSPQSLGAGDAPHALRGLDGSCEDGGVFQGVDIGWNCAVWFKRAGDVIAVPSLGHAFSIRIVIPRGPARWLHIGIMSTTSVLHACI